MLRCRSVQWQQRRRPERSAVQRLLDEVIQRIAAGRTYNLTNNPNCTPVHLLTPPPVSESSGQHIGGHPPGERPKVADFVESYRGAVRPFMRDLPPDDIALQ
jgi:hypothetical protein